MDDTVAVALITSLSTLTGAGLASWVSARTTSKQLRHQASLASAQRAEERATDFREVRREAYERFLTQVDAAYRELDSGWLTRTPAEPGAWEAGFAARRSLDEAHVRVRLVGPDDVAERGAEVVLGVGNEFRLHARIVSSHPDAQHCAADLDPTARTRALRARITTSEEFVTAARRALAGEVPHIPHATSEPSA